MDGLLNQSINLPAVFRDSSGEPVTGLSDVTVTVYGPDHAADVSAGACTELGSTGHYYRAFTPDQKGTFIAIFSTATSVYAKKLSVSFYIADPADLKATGFSTFNPASDTVTVGTNNDKTGYALTSAYDAAKSAASATALQTVDDNVDAIKSDTDAYLDAAVSSRLATTGYTAPDNAGIATIDGIADAIKLKTDLIPADPVDVSDLSGLSTFNPAVTSVTVGTNNDKTGYALTAAYDPAKTAASQTSIDIIDGIADDLKIVSDKLDTAMELDGAVYRFTVNSLENAPTGSGDANVNVVSVNGVSVTGPNDFKATGFSTFDPAIHTVDIGKVKGVSVTDISDFHASVDLSGISTFDPATDQVTVSVNNDKTGYSLANPDLCKADISGLLTVAAYTPADNTSIASILADTNELQTNQGSWVTADISSLALESTAQAVKTLTDKLSAMLENTGTYDRFKDTALEHAPDSVADISGLSTFDPATDTVIVSNTADCKADVSGLSTFNPATQTVNVGHIAGTAVTSPDDLKAVVDLSGLALSSDLVYVRTIADKLDTALVLDGAVYQFTVNALENAPTGSGDANVNVVSVNDIAVSGPDDFKAAGFSTFNPAVDSVIVGTNNDKTGYALANPDLCKADVSGLSTFNPATQTVDIGKVAGVAVTGIADFHTDVDLSNLDVAVSSRLASADYTAPSDISGLSTFDPATDPVNVGSVAGSAVTGTADFKADLTTVLSNLNTLLTRLSEIRISKLDVTGVIANTDNAGAFKADSVTVDTTGLATEANLDLVKAVTDKLNGLIENVTGNRFTAKALEQAPTGSGGTVDLSGIEADLDTLLAVNSEERLSKLDIAGTLAHTGNADLFKADSVSVDLTGIALESSVQAVKAKTDNLPVVPAGETNATANKEAILSAIGGIDTTVDLSAVAKENTLTAVKERTDRLPDIPADKATVLLIKAKTDLLPAAPASETNATANKNEIVSSLDSIGAEVVNIYNTTENINNVTNILAAGSGTEKLTVQLYHDGTVNPISAASVAVYYSGQMKASGITGLDGDIEFGLEAGGPYEVLVTATGMTFPPTTVADVSGSVSTVIYGSVVSLESPPDVEDCLIYETLSGYNSAAEPVNYKAWARVITPYDYAGRLYEGVKTAGTWNTETKRVEWTLPRGAKCEFLIEWHGIQHDIVKIPNAGYARLADLKRVKK